MATIMADEIEKATGFKPIKGLLNVKGKLRLSDDHLVDSIIPDYNILNEIDYKYPAHNAYFAYMTRGCIRRCPFCAVYIIEPRYVKYIPLEQQIAKINEKYGEKKDLLLLDNNILASSEFNSIINEIKDIGFCKGAKLKGRNRYVDFNQGIDLRLLTKEKLKKLAEISIKPLRIAFDNIKLKDEYIKKIEWAAEYGLLNLSNYILYNFEDTPEDFYERLRINIELNERLGTKIFSFPMKYLPVNNPDRKFIGKHWNFRFLRSIQCILNATRGLVGPKRDFFEAAFGKDVNEFKKLLLMPDNYIIYREKHKDNGATHWNSLYNSLPFRQKEEFRNLIYRSQVSGDILSKYPEVNELLSHYKKHNSEKNNE